MYEYNLLLCGEFWTVKTTVLGKTKFTTLFNNSGEPPVIAIMWSNCMSLTSLWGNFGPLSFMFLHFTEVCEHLIKRSSIKVLQKHFIQVEV